MTELLLALAFWPWALFLALLVLCTISAYSEITFIGFAALLLFTVVAWWLFDGGPVYWIIDKPGTVIALVIVYACTGGLWSLFKWRSHMVSNATQSALKSAKEKFDKDPKKGDFIDSVYFPADAMASLNKSRIVSWISLWPFSVFLYVFDDLLLHFFNRIYDILAGAYERITKRHLPK